MQIFVGDCINKDCTVEKVTTEVANVPWTNYLVGGLPYANGRGKQNPNL